jgi:hypothetical protein
MKPFAIAMPLPRSDIRRYATLASGTIHTDIAEGERESHLDHEESFDESLRFYCRRNSMRKRLTNQASPIDESWLDLQRLAEVELTSEDAAHPIEAALMPGAGSGWRAAQPGEQTIRFLFDELQTLKRIRLAFEEDQRARTQEFVLRWSADGRSYREILRQQYNFSPAGVPRELEDYVVNLAGVKALELKIIPDISGGDCRASLAELRIA